MHKFGSWTSKKILDTSSPGYQSITRLPEPMLTLVIWHSSVGNFGKNAHNDIHRNGVNWVPHDRLS